MSEFKRVAHGTRSPTQCVFCGDHAGPFIDTETELPVYGHLYICARTERRPGCIAQMARCDDMVEKERLDLAEARISFLEKEISDGVDAFRKSKVVSLDDVLNYQDEMNRKFEEQLAAERRRDRERQTVEI